MNALDQLLSTHRIIVSAGTGGVGKTSVSAALAVYSANQKRKTLVMTVDPSKRLATSLGLDTVGDSIHPVNEYLHAVSLDTQKTLENFIEKVSPRPDFLEKLKTNSIYQVLSKDFSGIHDYLALLKLDSLLQDSSYDTIILDTPPSRNTLRFLKSPEILNHFFEEKWVRMLLLPTQQWVGASIKGILSTLESLTGKGFISDLLHFAASLFEIQEALIMKLKRISAVFQSSDCGFVLVTTLQEDVVHEVELFVSELDTKNFHFRGVFFNRTLGHLESELSASHNNDADAQLIAILNQHIEREKILLRGVTRLTSGGFCFMIPELQDDICHLERLKHFVDVWRPYP